MRELDIERVFDAPRALVWKAFTDPDEFAQWYGPVGHSIPRESVHLDTEVGGVRRFGEIVGTIDEFVDGELIVTHADLGFGRIALRLEFHDEPKDRTRLVLRHGPFADDALADTGAGWAGAFTKLDRLLGITDGGRVVITPRGDREFVIARTFRAPARQVWDAITDPELIAQWWAGQRGTIKSVEHDLRVGGKWRNVMETHDGTEVAFSGEYKEIDAPRRVVSTEAFEASPDFPSLNTVTLTEDGEGATRLETHVLAATPEARDMQLQSGMEVGVQEGFDLLEKLAQARA
ncbi:MAG: SRPBCC family protein [Baekduia sp.]